MRSRHLRPQARDAGTPRARPAVLLFVAVAVASSDAQAARWLEIRADHLVVVGDVGERKAGDLIGALGRLQLLFASRGGRVDPGKDVVVFAMRNEESVRQLLGKRAEGGRNGVYVSGPSRDVLAFAIDLDRRTPFRVALHEYAHLLNRLNHPRLPPWLDEGLAELYSTLRADGDTVYWGRLAPIRVNRLRATRVDPSVIVDSSWMYYLGRPGLPSHGRLAPLPLEELLASTRRSDSYRRPEQAEMFYAQSAAFVHYLLLGTGPFEDSLLADFLFRGGAGEAGLSIDEIIGDVAATEKAFRAHASRHSFRPRRERLAEEIRPVRAVPLQAAEIAAYRADFLVRVGLIEEAKQVLERARAEGNPTSLAYEALGMLLTRHGDGLAGLEAYRRATELDSGNASAQYERGILALELAGDDGEEGMAALASAIDLEPNLAAAHLAIARALMVAHETLDEACQRAEGAARLEPGGLEHLADLLRCAVRLGDAGEATRLAATLAAEPSLDGRTALAERAVVRGELAEAEALLLEQRRREWRPAELVSAASFYERRGELDVARRLLEAGLAVRSESQPLRDALRETQSR